MHERRKHNRLSAKFFIIIQSVGKKKDDITIGHTRDISSRGIYAYTSARLSVGERVALRVHCDSDWAEGGAPPEFSGEGGIIRVEGSPKKKKWMPTADNGVAIKLANELLMTC
jgi:hypothetical protein